MNTQEAFRIAPPEKLNYNCVSRKELDIYKNIGYNSYVMNHYYGRKRAFTLAEVLITLGIIGVVAAMTIPVLITKYQKEQIVVRLKKTYTVMNQAVRMSIANDTWTQPPTDKRYDQAAMVEWLKTALIPYLNGAQVYDKNPIDQFPASYPAIVLADGSTLVLNNNAQIHVLYDLNGNKGPNKAGKDWFYFMLDYNLNTNTKQMGYFYPSGYVFAKSSDDDENPHDNYIYGDRDKMIKFCGERANGYSNSCALLIMNDGWQIKDDYPW